ncbi:3-ketosteroid-9-alpha-monooxygenase oxygenase subunit [compost metagenome]
MYQLRRWYQQFFEDIADIKPEMVNRFEAETDTRHAQPVWEQQAAEKLAEYAPQAAAKSQD